MLGRLGTIMVGIATHFSNNEGKNAMKLGQTEQKIFDEAKNNPNGRVSVCISTQFRRTTGKRRAIAANSLVAKGLFERISSNRGYKYGRGGARESWVEVSYAIKAPI